MYYDSSKLRAGKVNREKRGGTYNKYTPEFKVNVGRLSMN